MDATRAAGAMLIAANSSDPALFSAAAFVHCAISLFWAAVLAESLLASTGIAVLDLRVIGRLFPEVYGLPFWPQFADHLAWGSTLGVALKWSARTHSRG